MVQSADIVDSLAGAGRRLTGTRRAVAEMIAAQPGHFTADELLAASRKRRPAVGRATVFRTLDLLGSLGLVERVDLPDGTHAYLACQPAGHHHHIVCEQCGRSAEIGDLGLSPILAQVERETGYTLQSHRLELYGLCDACAAGPTPRRTRRRPNR